MTSEAKRGRPKKIDLVTLDQAVIFIQEQFKSPVPVYEKATLYNKIWRKELHRYGPRHMVLLDKNELIEKLCG